MAEMLKTVVSWDATQCTLADRCKVSQDKTTFIFRVPANTLKGQARICHTASHRTLYIPAGEDFESANTSNVA